MAIETSDEVSLHSGDPGDPLEPGDEAARESISWNSLSGGIYESNPVSFSLPAEVDITHAVFWDGGVLQAEVEMAISTFSASTVEVTFTYDSATSVVTATTSEDDEENVLPLMAMEILNDVVTRAPTSLTVALADGHPITEVDFYIDGVLVYSTFTNTDGVIPPVSIAVSDRLGTVGTHTLVAQQEGAAYAEATFTVLSAPDMSPRRMGADAPAVEVPGTLTTNGTRRWVLQDLLPAASGGIGSYIMPMNPKEMTSPHLEKNMTSRHTTAITGQFHVWEGSPQPKEWQFSGYCPTQEMHDKIQQYRELNRRFYIIDHRNRAWKVIIRDIKWEAKLHQNYNGTPTNWGHDYTVDALILDQAWTEPAP